MNQNKHIFIRTYLVYIGFVLIMLLVLFKTASIQFGKRTNKVKNSEGGLPVRTTERIPRRGEILDVNYTPLVTSVSLYEIHMDPTVVKQEVFDKEIND